MLVWRVKSCLRCEYVARKEVYGRAGPANSIYCLLHRHYRDRSFIMAIMISIVELSNCRGFKTHDS